LQVNNAQEMLVNFEKSHLFTFSFDEEHNSFYYHRLFQGFLQSKVQTEIGREEIFQLHHRAARLYEENFEYEEALKHYIASQAFEQAARVLGYLVPSMGLQGRFHLANSYLGKIPDQHWQEQPWLVFIKGHIQALGGKNQEASVCFQKALLLFKTKNDQIGIQRCLIELAVIHMFAGDFPKAEAILKQILTTNGLPPFASILNIGSLIIALAHLGKAFSRC
jgi:ATP/maltotriose-dependent transcriptional regulator MalT